MNYNAKALVVSVLSVTCFCTSITYASEPASKVNACRTLLAKLGDKPMGLWTPNDYDRREKCAEIIRFNDLDRERESQADIERAAREAARQRDARMEHDAGGLAIDDRPPPIGPATLAEDQKAQLDEYPGNFGINSFTIYKDGSLMAGGMTKAMGGFRSCKEDTANAARSAADRVYICQFHKFPNSDPMLRDGMIVRLHTAKYP